MNILIPGGTGQVGRILARAFVADGHEVVILSRKPAEIEDYRVIHWDSKTLGAWTEEVERADVVINLAGRSVNCRYNTANRRQMIDSRVDTARVIGQAIANSSSPPRVWLQASTATIYAHRYDAANDEATGIIGGSEDNAPDTWRFSIDVATAWEREAIEAHTPITRKVLLRSALTLSPDAGGIFDVLMGLARKGLGGTNGDGRQYVSWVHDIDFINALFWLIDREQFSGPINIASPNPIPNSDFMRILREAAGVRFGLPATKWMLELGAFFMRTETELLLKSRRVVPGRLLESGFQFRFAGWPAAANDLVRRWQSLRAPNAAGAR